MGHQTLLQMKGTMRGHATVPEATGISLGCRCSPASAAAPPLVSRYV
jgi:hypothetical protein